MYEPKVTGGAAKTFNETASCILVITSPLFCFFYSVSFHAFGTSLTAALSALLKEGPVAFFRDHLSWPTSTSIAVYIIWVIVQAALYIGLPGKTVLGPRTCGGRRLPYKLNGLFAWAVTAVAYVAAAYGNAIDPAFIAKNWEPLLSAATIYSFVLIAVFHVKARIHPDNVGETLITGHFWYDLFNGGELHPRTGMTFDWKHFNASRTGGILLWTLIDMSFAAWQYQLHGLVTKTMVTVVLFRAIVVVDYFWYENWFFETLDGSHERFSFYSIYGFAVMMPLLWTLQTQYLALHPIELSWFSQSLVWMLFIAGFALNHSVNGQKASCRKPVAVGVQSMIWGKPMKVIQATYHTSDGKIHHTVLLCSGWWALVRHANYIGSVMYTWASCLACGTHHLFPYAEAIIVTGIVVHRCWRDEARCKAKYGVAWDQYCEEVQWRMVPGIF